MRPRPLRWVTTSYHPDPSHRPFLERLEQQKAEGLNVSVAVLSDRESVKFFGAHLARRIGAQTFFDFSTRDWKQ